MISSKYENYTEYGIHSKTERYSWTAYHLLVLLSSLIGDTLILYASFQRDAFKLNKFIISVLQHIAVSNLALAFFSVLTTVTSLLGDSWLLGNASCYIAVHMTYWIYPAGMLFIAMMTTSKFLLLKYPLRAAYWTEKRGHQVCAVIWVICSLAGPMSLFVLSKDDVYFDYRVYNCRYGFTAKAWPIITPIYAIVLQLVPSFLIVGTTFPTLKYLYDAGKSSKRVQGSIPWQGATTVALAAIVYCISNLPILVYYIGKSFVEEPGPFHCSYYTIAVFMWKINIMANFYIYTLTIRSFRRFLFARILSIVLHSILGSRNRALDIEEQEGTADMIRRHETPA